MDYRYDLNAIKSPSCLRCIQFFLDKIYDAHRTIVFFKYKNSISSGPPKADNAYKHYLIIIRTSTIKGLNSNL